MIPASSVCSVGKVSRGRTQKLSHITDLVKDLRSKRMPGNLMKPGLLFCANLARRHWVLILPYAKWESNNILHVSMNIEDRTNVACFEKYDNLFRHVTETFLPVCPQQGQWQFDSSSTFCISCSPG